MFLSILAMSGHEIARIISIAAIALISIIALIFATSKKDAWTTKMLAVAAMCIGLSFVLSFIKFKMAFGGSVTLASFVPLIIFSYIYGFKRGLLAGLVYAVLQYIQEPWFLNVFQFLFDFFLAFSSIAVAGIFKKKLPQTLAVLLGTFLVGLIRFIMHVCAGIMFFNAGYVKTLPIFGEVAGALTYSMAYNAVYLVPDIIICILVLWFLCKTKTLDRLIKIAEK